MTKEALKLALEALEETLPYAQHALQDLENLYDGYIDLKARKTRVEREDVERCEKAIAAIKEALAAPQETTGNIVMDSYKQMVAMKEAAPQEGVITINGKHYAEELFGTKGFLSEPGTILRIEAGPGDVVTCTTLAAPAPLSNTQIWQIAAGHFDEYAEYEQVIEFARNIEQHIRGVSTAQAQPSVAGPAAHTTGEPVEHPTFTKHEVDAAGDWSDWVCPDPQKYLIKCCDCGLVHEAQYRVVKYAGDDFEVVNDVDTQAQFRMRRSDEWNAEDTAYRPGGLPQEVERHVRGTK